jgi:polysaccharide chain length determinant protein (PEP-CTERM system associated)
MLGHRDLNVDDYIAILRRRLWVILVPMVVAPALAYAYSLTIPDRYTSQTLVLVEQQKVPQSYVRSVVTDELNERLGTMKEQILSRTRLQPIIERLELWKDDWNRAPMEELVGRLRASIVVTPVRPVVPQGQAQLPGFFITVTHENARRAQQICTDVTSMFIEENLRLREQRAQGTTDFLAKQLEEAKRKLDEQDGRLAAFKRQYIAQLPGQEQMNMNILMGLNTQLEAVTQLLNRTQQDRAYMMSLLDQQVAAWEASQAGNNPATLEQQMAALQNQLVTLEARYTPDHPDVIKLKNDIAQLKKKIDEATAAASSQKDDKEHKARLTEPPQIQQLRNQVHQADQTIREKTRELERIQEQIKVYQARVQLSPMIEQQYKELTRDYQTALDFYNSLLAKKTESEMATELERRQQGEQFRVMDPANLPERPSYPNRLMFAGGGLAIGMGLGFAIALLLELRDKTIRNERDVEFYLAVPTLGLLPTIDHGNGAAARKFWQPKRPAGPGRQAVEA